MKLGKLSPKLIIGLLITIFFGVSLTIRTVLPFDTVFGGDWVRFTSIDAYYHMFLVDNLVNNFPGLTDFSPFFIFPGGSAIGSIYFFDWLLAGIIWLIGLGSPSQHTIDVVGVYFPAILGALTVIPVFFIGKALFNKWVGVLAAGLIAIFPGEYLGRSILGFTDYHVAETLFSATAVLFLILAIKKAGQRGLTWSHLIKRDRSVIIKPLVYSLLAGIFMGIYLITWQGALLFTFIISVYFVVQFIINHLRQKPSEHLGIAGFIMFLVAFIIYLPFSPAGHWTTAQFIALLIPLALSGISMLVAGRNLKPFYYPLALVGIAVIFMVIFRFAAPNTFEVLLSQFGIFTPGGATAATTLEMQPFLSPQGSFTTSVAWGNFTTSFFLIPAEWGQGKIWFPPGIAFISLITLFCIFVIKRRDEEHWLLFLIWSVIIFIATFVQRRFAYYLVINIAILSAYASWLAIWYAGLRKLEARSQETAEVIKEQSHKAKKQKKQEKSGGITIYHINTALAIIVVFFCVFFPNIPKAQEVASAAFFAPSAAWQSSLIWMKENTPEPMGEPDAYYQLYERDYEYPESAYGVTTWWDYGYWVTRTAQRIPSANPSQAPAPISKVANLFLSQDEALTHEIMEELGSSYLMIDYQTCTSKFWAVSTWAGAEEGKYIGLYYIAQGNELVPLDLFHPEYYETLAVRLFNFDGKAVTDTKPMVITYVEEALPSGGTYKRITDFQEFDSIQEALNYTESEDSIKLQIVGVNPFISPVPIEAVENYSLIYSSETGVSYPDLGLIPEVKIFEYVK